MRWLKVNQLLQDQPRKERRTDTLGNKVQVTVTSNFGDCVRGGIAMGYPVTRPGRTA